MRYQELKEEWDEYAIVSGDVILRNPGPYELDFLLKQSHYGAVRLGFNLDDDLLIWSADKLSHFEMPNRIGLVSTDGFSLMKVGNQYKVWADSEGYSEQYWAMIRQNRHIKHMFRNKDIFDPSAASKFHNKF